MTIKNDLINEINELQTKLSMIEKRCEEVERFARIGEGRHIGGYNLVCELLLIIRRK